MRDTAEMFAVFLVASTAGLKDGLQERSAHFDRFSPFPPGLVLFGVIPTHAEPNKHLRCEFCRCSLCFVLFAGPGARLAKELDKPELDFD